MVNKAKHHIVEGDIFQIVLSNRLSADFDGSLLDTYRMLRTINPSPYMFYFCSDEIELAGASPETLVKLQDGVLHTFPLAGTRKRGAYEEEDARGKLEDMYKDYMRMAVTLDRERTYINKEHTYAQVSDGICINEFRVIAC